MDKKHKHQKGGTTHIPAADSFTNYDHAGWMSRLYHDGWLKKRWRKRYCVLSNGRLYVYEKQTAKGTESSSIAIDLAKFSSCVKATGKESKKSPNTIVLEPTVSNTVNGEKEQNNNNVAKEFFFTEDAVSIDKWMLKLKESLSLSCAGAKAKLEHVTKSRARPPRGGGGNRRPPTKQHIKERARMSEIAIDEEEEQPRKSARESRGRLPVTAIKPTGKPILPNSSLTIGKKVDAEKVNDDKTDATMTNSQKPSKEDEPNSAKTKSPPKLPPAALKPKSKPSGDSLMSKSEESDGDKENSEENSEGSESMDASADESKDDKSELNNKLTKSPPKLPPVAMKPKLKQSEIVDTDNDYVGDDDSASSTADSESSTDVPTSTSTKESSPTDNKPPALPPVALKPKVTPDKLKSPAEEQFLTPDSINFNGDDATGTSRSDSDLGDAVTHDEILQVNSIPKRKSLTDLKLSYESKNTPNRNRSNSL